MPGVVAGSCNASMGGSVGIDLIAAGQPVGVWVAALVTVPVSGQTGMKKQRS